MTATRTMSDITTPARLRQVMGADFEFSAQQFDAITAPLEPAVVVAGAGSGKTTVMAARVVWLVATGRVRPHEILGLTFTTKATAELAARIRSALRAAGLLPERPVPGEDGEEVEEPTVSTYHAYAGQLLAEHGLRIGHEPDARLVADASRYQLANRAVQRHRGVVEHLTDSPSHVIQGLLALDGELSEHLTTPDQVRRFDAVERERFEAGMAAEHRKTYRARNEKAISAIDRRAELLDLVESYRALKRDLGVVDFSDQIALAARLAQDCVEVGSAEREKFKVVLLDEYQDTSVAQALMLSRLFSGPDAEHGRGHPVTAVGDPNQAIYGWRGASVSNILDFGRDFPPLVGEPRRYPLTVNRRSDARILACANHLADDLYQARPELLPLEPAGGARDGEVVAVAHETYDDELDWLAAEVRACHDRRGIDWREIGVLTRSNSHAADVFDRLTRDEIPVEIVGLKGLLRLPEVTEVVATLTLLDDVTANPALLTLLAGPRWAVGPRDLALLGRRAQELSGAPGARGSARDLPVLDELAASVEGADPAEMTALADALEDPGDLDYSPEARERFALLAAELRRLRAAVGEPILDLVRRIIDMTGIDIELASSVSAAAAARRDNLDLFVQAVSEFQAVDGQVTLSALMAWLEAEDTFGQGLDVATPSEADSVKLLTVHRAKGLEWDAVFVVGVTEKKFPTSQSRSSHLTVPHVMPAPLRGDARDLPVLRGHTPEDIAARAEAAKQHEAEEELRLAYVAWTRAKHLLHVSGWKWHPQLKGGCGPSGYLERTREALAQWGASPVAWAEPYVKGEANPYAARTSELPWPISHRTPEVERRHAAAARVAAARERLREGTPDPVVEDVLVLDRIRQWDEELGRLLAEAQRDQSPVLDVPLPSSLSATASARLRLDPAGLAAELARPMPRAPSPAARFGTRFHAWVEARFGQQGLLDPDELPGRWDAGIDDDDDLEDVIRRFEDGPFAERVPHAVEAPFALVLGGQVVRGRIDAVYQEADGSYLLVDWKTSRRPEADPWQLAVYRLAWAELHDLPLERVRAAFHFVRTGQTVVPEDLPDRSGLEEELLRATGTPP